VTKDNVNEAIDRLYSSSALEQEKISANIPVLVYHHLDPEADGSNAMVVTPETFEAQIKALSEAGYTGITIQQMLDYVNTGEPLPEKPVLITLDDGYLSNYEYAFPILQKYNMKATIFVIGSSVGHTMYYKDTQYTLTPHFDLQQMKEMSDSGLISIQSHTYDMHQTEQYESGESPIRESMLKIPDESEDEYIQAMTDDMLLEKELLQTATGRVVNALAYPKGYFDELTATVVSQLGIDVTFTTESGCSTIIKGMPQSLYGLPRLAVYDSTTPEQLLEMVSAARG
jgi:peptidoglycan/xylan/chitin deacetylase (PgdA/CDA1 family)